MEISNMLEGHCDHFQKKLEISDMSELIYLNTPSQKEYRYLMGTLGEPGTSPQHVYTSAQLYPGEYFYFHKDSNSQPSSTLIHAKKINYLSQNLKGVMRYRN